jgi:tetratricopeptide (TPR) repeat protein
MVSPSTFPLALSLSKGEPALRMYPSNRERLRSSFDWLRTRSFDWFRTSGGLVIALWLAVIACRAPARPALRAVPLPDLSRAAESVRAQLGERHAALTRAIDNPTASPNELADAYGTMGMLLMAAEYREEAEACLLNAEALAPDVVKWPYYLAHLYRAGGDNAKSEVEFERVLRLQPRNASARSPTIRSRSPRSSGSVAPRSRDPITRTRPIISSGRSRSLRARERSTISSRWPTAV